MTSPRPREPLSLRQPVSPAGVLYSSEIGGLVAETATDVKKNVIVMVTYTFQPPLEGEVVARSAAGGVTAPKGARAGGGAADRAGLGNLT